MHPSNENLADFSTTPRVLFLTSVALVIGVAGALVATLLLWLIRLFTNLAFFWRWSTEQVSPEAAHHGLWIVTVPVLGGLVIGLMARYGSEKIRGHGIPEALEAIIIGRSRLDAKVAVLKPVSSAISIGTGGPFGAEGPIIMTGGAVGSMLAQALHVTSAERKTLLVAGAAAGMAAVFATPIAAVLLAVELLLFEWKPRSFIPVACAAATAAAVRVPLLGGGPLFAGAPHHLLSGQELAIALIVGVVAGFASALLTGMVYAAEDAFLKLRFHWMWWPMIGGLVVGIGGYFEPRILGVGYDVIHDVLAGHIVGAALIGILIGKAVIWSVSLGSGTSGGVLAPLLMMGAALGALESQIIPFGDTGLWAMISMAAIMGGTMRSPLTAILFALELTHDTNALPGLLVGVVAAQCVTVLVMKRSILTEKVARRGHHLTREYTVDPLDVHRVSEVMLTKFDTVRATTTVEALSDKHARDGRNFVRHQGAPIVDESGRLVGVITLSDLVKRLDEPDHQTMTAIEVGSTNPIVAYPDEVLRDVVARMVRHDIGRLPVVDRADEKHLAGYID